MKRTYASQQEQIVPLDLGINRQGQIMEEDDNTSETFSQCYATPVEQDGEPDRDYLPTQLLTVILTRCTGFGQP